MQDEMEHLDFNDSLDESIKVESSVTEMVRKHHMQVSNNQGIEPSSSHFQQRSFIQADVVEVEDLDVLEESTETNGNILLTSDRAHSSSLWGSSHSCPSGQSMMPFTSHTGWCPPGDGQKLDKPGEDYKEACAKETLEGQRFNSSSHGHQRLNGSLEHEITENRDSNLSSIYQGEWPIDGMYWNSGTDAEKSSLNGVVHQDTSSIISFNCSMTGSSLGQHRSCTHQFGTKVDMVYSLLSMLGSHDKEDMSRTLLEMSASKESCIVMRQSGCLPLLVQLLHGSEKDSVTPEDSSYISYQTLRETRQRASQALHNIVHAHPDDKRGRREARVLRLLEQIRDYCNHLRDVEAGLADDDHNVKTIDHHPGPAIAAIMKLSFDEEHRHAICQLGGLQAIAQLIQVDDEVHGNTSDQYCVTLRRYAGMALTNLTFGDGTNKALLCSMKPFMQALVSQLHSPSEDLRQVTASVLRNLSWRADSSSKATLRETGAVTTLMKAAMEAFKESTLKSILSALWNLSAHCTSNKADICAIDGALAFLVNSLIYKSPSKTLAIIENGGGILRNISSHIAIQEGYRAILRKHNCLQILLQHLKSPSLTVVSNACGTLWNLSARCLEDQRALWEMGAVGMLRNLVHSRHKMISMGSSAALKNLLSAKPPGMHINFHPSSEASLQRFGNNAMPSLLVRKQRALEAEIDQNLSETYDNTDSPKTSPTHTTHSENRFVMSTTISPYYTRLPNRMYHSITEHAAASNVSRSESHDSIGSTCSEPPHHHRIKGAYNMVSKSAAKYITVDHRHLHKKTLGWQMDEGTAFKDNHIHLTPSTLTAYSTYSLPNTRVNDSPDICRTSLHEKDVTNKQTGDLQGLNDAEVKSEIHSKNKATCEESIDIQDSCLKKDISLSQTSQLSHLDRYASLAQKIKTIHLEEQETQDQPVNYSLKYSDENAIRQNSINSTDSHNSRIPLPRVNNYVTKDSLQSKATAGRSCLPLSVNREKWKETKSLNFHQQPKCISNVDNAILTVGEHTGSLNHGTLYASYAETDLDTPDQPTDYSQKYKEHMDTTEDYISSPNAGEEKLFHSSNSSKILPSVHDDTLKVYCTEGTPLNFSSASSLTDLREIAHSNGHLTESPRNSKTDSKSLEKEEDHISFSNDQKNALVNEKKEKQPLESIKIEQETVQNNNYEKLHERTTMAKKVLNSSEKEGKTVTFDEEVNYADETPLMFSRCSSLGSLSSFDQHSIHDDCSSVVSDFSRHTSGLISPSDLPDSPSQTMPSSPCRTKPPVFEFTNDVSDVTENVVCKPTSVAVTTAAASTSIVTSTTFNTVLSSTELSPAAIITSPTSVIANDITSTGVFEDVKTSYNEEGTPAEFSRTTSLSSLTIDDEPKFVKEVTQTEKENPIIEESESEASEKRLCDSEGEEGKSSEISHSPSHDNSEKFSPSTESSSPNCNQNETKSEDASDDEENEDLLAACISSGMPNNSSSRSSRNNNSKLRSRVNKLGSHHLRNSSGIPLKTTNIRATQTLPNSSNSVVPSNVSVKDLSPSQDIFGEDSVKVYRTEGTPANLSHATSLSELSTLSCADECIKSNSTSINLQDNHSDSSSVCDDNESILLQCIQSGMPHSKKQVSESQLSLLASSDQNFKSKLKKSSDLNLTKNHFSSKANDTKQKSTSPNKNTTMLKKINSYNYSSNWQEDTQNLDHKPSINKTLSKPYSSSENFSLSSTARLNEEESLCYASPAIDSPRLYNVEGTPVMFSCNDSLSSLSCEDGIEVLSRDVSTSYKLQDSSKDESKNNASVQKSHSLSRSQIISIPSQTANKHSPVKQKSFHQVTTPEQDNSNQHSLHFQKSDESHSYLDRDNTLCLDGQKSNMIEGTPICFSRNSSLSSLSVESLNEPSSSEQALLEECISCGMPKEKPSRKSKTKRNKAPKPNNHNINANINITAEGSSEKCKKEENNGEIKIQDQFEIMIHDNTAKESGIISEVEQDYEEKGKEDERSQEKNKLIDFDQDEISADDLQLYNQPEETFQRKEERSQEESKILDFDLDQNSQVDSQLDNQSEQSFQGSDLSFNEKQEECGHSSSDEHLHYETSTKNEVIIKQDLHSDNIAISNTAESPDQKDMNTDMNSNISEDQNSVSISLQIEKEEEKNQNRENFVPQNTERKTSNIEVCKSESKPLESNDKDDSQVHKTNHVYKHHPESQVIEKEFVEINETEVSNYIDEAVPVNESKSEITFSELANEMSSPKVLSEKIDLQVDTNASENVINDNASIAEDGSAKMTLSTAIFNEAKHIVETIEAECDTADEMTASIVSCVSDLDNVKPPSVMADILSISLTSSGLSENLKPASETAHANNKAYNSKIVNKSHKHSSKSGKYHHVPEMVRRALGENFETRKFIELGTSDIKPYSVTDSVDSVSMKSSCTSDLLENINPPSVMDDISLTTSCASLSSISSEILDEKSHVDDKTHTPKSTCTDDMFERFNAASAMVQLYSRELSNIMTGSSIKTSSTSEIIDQVKPPSAFQDMTEVTVGDITEIVGDTLGSDTELEEELPCDDDDEDKVEEDIEKGNEGEEIDDDDDDNDPGSDTLQASHIVSLSKDEPGEGSTENLTLTLTEEVVETDNRDVLELDALDKTEMTAEEIKALQLNADLVVCALNNIRQAEYEEEFNLGIASQNIIMIEDESISLVSSESDDDMLSPESQEAYPEPVIKRKLFWENLSKEANQGNQLKKEPGKKSDIVQIKGKLIDPEKTKIVELKKNVLTAPPADLSCIGKISQSSKPFSKLVPPSKVRTSQHISRLLPKSSVGHDTAQPGKDDQSTSCSTPSASHRLRYAESSSSGSDGEEKPKVLLKQGTFIKEKPSQSTSHILPPRQNYHINKSMQKEKQTKCLETSVEVPDSVNSKPADFVNKTEIGPKTEDINSNIRKIYSGTFTRRKKAIGNIGHSFSSQEDDSENLSDRQQTPSPSGISYQSGSPGSCSNSNVSLSSSSSTGTSIRKTESGGVAKQVPSKIASAWKKKDNKRGRYLTRESVMKYDRMNASKSPVPDSSSSSSCSSKNGDTRILGINKRTKSPGMRTSSPLGNLSRSSTYEKLPQESQSKAEGHASRKPVSLVSSPSLGRKIVSSDHKIDSHTWKRRDLKYGSTSVSKPEMLSNKEKKLYDKSTVVNKGTYGSAPQHPDKRGVQSKLENLVSDVDRKKSHLAFSTVQESTVLQSEAQDKDNDSQQASSRIAKPEVKSMIPTPFKKVGSAATYRKGTFPNVQQDESEKTGDEGDRQRTCLVTTV